MHEKFDSQSVKDRPRSQWFFSETDDYVLSRTHMYEFACAISDYLLKHKNLKVLEVGPAGMGYHESIQSLSTNVIEKTCRDNGIYYKTLDIVSDFGCDYLGSIEDLSFVKEKFDVVILLGIIEHVPKLHLVADQLRYVTTDDGILFINTPYLFKVHGPIPDCWRISPYGFLTLFEGNDMAFNVYPEGEIGKNTFPLSISAVITKSLPADQIIPNYVRI